MGCCLCAHGGRATERCFVCFSGRCPADLMAIPFDVMVFHHFCLSCLCRFVLGLMNGIMPALRTSLNEVCGPEHVVQGMTYISGEHIHVVCCFPAHELNKNGSYFYPPIVQVFRRTSFDVYTCIGQCPVGTLYSAGTCQPKILAISRRNYASLLSVMPNRHYGRFEFLQ